MKKFYKNIQIIFLISTLFLILLFILRFHQKFLNLQIKSNIINSEVSFKIPLNSEEENIITSYQTSINEKNPDDWWDETSSPLYRQILFLNTINDNKEIKLSNKLLKDSENIEEKENYLNYTLTPSIGSEMECSNFESARYKAQRLINNQNILNPLNRNLTYARKILKITKFNLYNFDKIFLTVINNINIKDDGYFLSKKETNEMMKSLEKNSHVQFVPYYIYDLKENDLNTSFKKFKYWSNFQKEFPNNIFTEEAIYNKILYALKSQEKLILNNKKEYKKLTKIFYNQTSIFEKDFSKSYLLDDILYLKILYSVSDNNYKHFKKSYQWFIENDSNSPYFKILKNRLFIVKEFDYTDFISNAIKMKSKMTLEKYMKISSLDNNYLKKVKQMLISYEGKNYNKLTLERIIMNILKIGKNK